MKKKCLSVMHDNPFFPRQERRHNVFSVFTQSLVHYSVAEFFFAPSIFDATFFSNDERNSSVVGYCWLLYLVLAKNSKREHQLLCSLNTILLTLKTSRKSFILSDVMYILFLRLHSTGWAKNSVAYPSLQLGLASEFSDFQATQPLL